MAQQTSFIPQYQQGNTMNQYPRSGNAFVVVDQQPIRSEVFPYSLPVKGILVFSIFKCIVGSLLFLAGIANVIVVRYEVKIAFGIWCGLTILANGIIGCVLRFKQNKCLIGSFLALSITSLIFDVSMLSYYSVVLDYFIEIARITCYYNMYGRYCVSYLSSGDRSRGIGISSFLLFLGVCELACSIGSVVLSSKAYCKCCNTCDTNDCGTCLGCCDCDITPLNIQQQDRQPFASASYNNQNIQVASAPPTTYVSSPNPLHSNTPVQAPAQNMQGSQANPCSGLMNFVINMPAYLFGGTNGTQLSALNVSIQAVPLNQQNPVTDPDRNVRQVHVVDTHGTEQNPASSTWQQLET